MPPAPPRLLAALLVALLAAPTAAGAQTASEAGPRPRALAPAEDPDLVAAVGLAGAARDRVAADVALWMRLRGGTGDWPEYTAFLARNADWPSQGALRRGAETAMPAGLPPATVIAFFAETPPLTGIGSLRYAQALAAGGRDAEAEAEILRGWPTLPMSSDAERAILARWGTALAPLHVARLDNLLWAGRTIEAERMLPLAPSDWRALARARIAVRRDADGSSALIDAVPAALRADPGLAYERYLWRIDKDRTEEAADLLIGTSSSAAALGRPDLWMEHRASLAREALRAGRVEDAYLLAARSFGAQGPDFADSEWLAGYIALTARANPARAITHFRRFRDAVFTPISLGRAGYWLGVAYDAAGDDAAAREAFAQAARFQTGFYGQLAAGRIGAAPDDRLAGGEAVLDWRGQDFMRTTLVQGGLELYRTGEDLLAATLLRHAARSLPADQRAALAQMAVDIGAPHIGLRIAKDAAADGMLLPEQYYPLHAIAASDWPVPTEFALAIARQESEFDAGALSPAGARGLMQLMPATAREVAKLLGVDYDGAALTADPAYNARLGTGYLARMLDRYDGSFVLATAAYNAGPGRVGQWIEEFGDPRSAAADPVAWIEAIPFDETRNYVMRVLESLQVYRARLAGKAVPVRLAADIGPAGG